LGRRKRFQSIVGVNEKMQALYSIIENVAPSNISVMITGESGTGKELVAQAIHRLSGRRDREIVDVNCAAIPAELMESELFGHERGSFTGANQRHIGCCERADKSTLFLDEICEMDISLQAKLLRFLQERYFQRVGGKERVYVDTRILSATNKDPLEVVRQGQFREDLFYRLNVVTIEVPPLRERRDDIPLLAQHFLETVSRENDKPFREISKEAAYLLSCHDWPGNVRELQNAVVQAVALHSGTTLAAEMLPPAMRREITIPADFTVSTLAGPDIRPEPFQDSSTVPSDGGETQIIPLAETEKNEIERALRICLGNTGEVCKNLGISQATLYRKIKEYGLKTAQFKEKK
ncbi:MAG TPA: sigma-54 dependent transcriptional regulator, partial [bacterium]|nr:sigma-54 dependent transcriptional regulator [bacterium]